MKPEAVILNQVRDYLQLNGWYVIRIQQGMGCHKGLSDLICLIIRSLDDIINLLSQMRLTYSEVI